MYLLDLLVYVDAHPKVQAAIYALCLGITGALVLAPLIKKQISPRVAFFNRPGLFIALMAISLFAYRYPIFFYPLPLNPDEAQMLAQAITYESHPVPWRDVDGTTSGPINSYALLWCLPLGIQPGYLTGRILELSCLWGMFVFLYWSARQVAGDLAARLCLMPVFLFICWNSSSDFIHYSSETISLVLLAGSLYLTVKLRNSRRAVLSIVGLGLCLGLLPFAKLQSILPGGFLGLSAIWFLFTNRVGDRQSNFIRIAVLVGSATAPALLILGIVAYAGALGDFWESYIRMAQTYGVRPPSFLSKLKSMADLFVWIFSPGAIMAIPLYLTEVPTVVLAGYFLRGTLQPNRKIFFWFIWTMLFGAFSVLTVIFTGRSFLHYQLFLLPALSFQLAINFRLIRLRSGAHLASPVAGIMFASLLLCLLLLADYTFSDKGHHSVAWHAWLRLTDLALLIVMLWPITGLSFNGRPLPPLPLSQKSVPWFALVVFFVIPTWLFSLNANEYRGNVTHYLAQPVSLMDQTILRERPVGGRLAIWGWAAEFAAETRTPLGTRDSICQFVIDPTPLQGYYRERYLRDMRTNRPELFLEATGPHNFGYNDSSLYGLETFPELAKYIQEHYQLCQVVDGMRLFIRSDLAKTGSIASPEAHP